MVCGCIHFTYYSLSLTLTHKGDSEMAQQDVIQVPQTTKEAYLTVRNLPSFSCGELFPTSCLLLIPRLRESRSKSGGTCDMGGSLLRAKKDTHQCRELTKSQVLIHPYRLCNIRGSLLRQQRSSSGQQQGNPDGATPPQTVADGRFAATSTEAVEVSSGWRMLARRQWVVNKDRVYFNWRKKMKERKHITSLALAFSAANKQYNKRKLYKT